MFKCTGVCSSCGRCRNAAMMSGANERKTRMITYPDSFSPDRNRRGYGIAFDIGTTTVVGILWNLESGVQIDTCAETNPQNEFGMDIISRINCCSQNKANLELIRHRIIECMNSITGRLCSKTGITGNDIIKAAVCGNTTMSHIFSGYSPVSLAAAPFLPAYTGTLKLTAKESQLDISEDAEVTVLPNIAGHVGGDITAGIAAARVLEQQGLTMFIDIGTNGEIVLGDGKGTLACSTAAGPAFEGAAILNGMRAVAGAIEQVHITEDGEVFFNVIGDCEPQGICGSGLIDAIAQLLNAGLINKSGRLAGAEDIEKKGLHEAFSERLAEVEGERRFILVSKVCGEDIVITQNDIREVQLAKAAVSAGISLMLEELRRRQSDIDRVIIAGAFGNYIDKKSAVRIGLLPDISEDNIVLAGNTAGAGVSMALASDRELENIKLIPQRVKHIELAAKPEFQNTYLKAMGF